MANPQPLIQMVSPKLKEENYEIAWNMSKLLQKHKLLTIKKREEKASL